MNKTFGLLLALAAIGAFAVTTGAQASKPAGASRQHAGKTKGAGAMKGHRHAGKTQGAGGKHAKSGRSKPQR